MKNRTDTPPSHHRAWEAIPWVVNGRASNAQRLSVEAHASECVDCRAELARQRELHGVMTQDQATMTNPDLGLWRLLKRIDQVAHDSAQLPSIRTRPTGWNSRALVYGLTFAVVVEAIGISVLGMGLLSHTEPAPRYETLSSMATGGSAATIRMVPDANMKLGELQVLLTDLELQVVAGPNAVGAYALAPSSARFPLDKQLAFLRAVPGMRLVEPIRQREVGG